MGGTDGFRGEANVDLTVEHASLADFWEATTSKTVKNAEGYRWGDTEDQAICLSISLQDLRLQERTHICLVTTTQVFHVVRRDGF